MLVTVRILIGRGFTGGSPALDADVIVGRIADIGIPPGIELHRYAVGDIAIADVPAVTADSSAIIVLDHKGKAIGAAACRV